MESTYNYLPDNVFRLSIHEMPLVSFYCQELTLPNVSVDNTEVPFPGANLILPGNQTRFSTLDVTFIIDEKMRNYEEVFRWVMGQRANSKDSEKYGNLVSDVVVNIFTANSTFNRTMFFKGSFPVNIGPVTFRTTDQSIVYTTCTVSFAFTDFDMT